MPVYLDTSAAAKLVVAEPETRALAAYLDALDPEDPPVASALLETELRRIMVRLDLPQSAATGVLDRVALAEVHGSLLHEAGVLPGARLRSLDAIHLATAIRLGAETVLAYDRRLLTSALDLGLAVASPQ